MYSRHRGGESVGRSPVLGGEEGEADFAGGEGDVWVGDAGVEGYAGRMVRVGWGNCYCEVPQAV